MMNMLQSILTMPKDAMCAVFDGISYTYHDLCVAAISVRSEAPKRDTPTFHVITHEDPLVQLCDVLAFAGTLWVPLILPVGSVPSLPLAPPPGASLAVVEHGELVFPDLPVWLAEADRTQAVADLSDPEQLRTALITLLEGGTVRIQAI